MKIKLIQQHDEKDCGAACLAMISKFYGLSLPLVRFRELTGTDNFGTNIYGIVQGAEKIGLSAEALVGNWQEFLCSAQKKEIRFPVITHTVIEGFEHYIVVYKIDKKYVYVADPGRGKKKYSHEDFQNIWTGNIIVFEGTDNFRKGNYVPNVFVRFLKLLKGQYRLVAYVALMAVLVAGISIASSFAFEYVIDRAITITDINGEYVDHEHEETEEDSEHDESTLERFIDTVFDNLHVVCIAVIVIYALQAVFRYWRERLLARIAQRLDIKLLIGNYRKMTELPLSFFNQFKTGDVISRFSDTALVRDGVTSVLLTVILDSTLALGCGIVLYCISSALFSVALITVLLNLLIMLFYLKPIKRVNHEIMESNAKVISYLKESVDGIEMVKAMQCEERVNAIACGKISKLIGKVFNGSLIYASKFSLAEMVKNISQVLLFWIGVFLILQETVSLGALITFYFIMSYFTDPMQRLIEVQETLQSADIALERLNDIVGATTEETICPKCEIKKSFSTDIRFENIDFRYGTRKLVLKNINLEIKSGEKVAIVGESGCGKTTLVKLLMKFYKPEKGNIFLGERDLCSLSNDDVRSNISYISQNPFFFSDSIRNNLCLKRDFEENEILRACKIFQAYEFIEKMPYGLDTLIEENATNLSAGQKQKLAIVRAYLQQTELLIMDEATSNLDSISENGIQQLLFSESNNKTVIFIAHKLSTIKSCDKIVVMKDGEIREVGNHLQLITQKGLYYDYYTSQV